jgi:hypothetical protein
MPPVNTLSLPSTPLTPNVLLSHSLFTRSLPPESSSPKRGFFSTLFNAISSITILESLLRNIMTIWDWVHPIHIRNTHAAQLELDMEFLEYYRQEWKDKNRLANVCMMKTLAIEKPYYFIRGYVLDKREGSDERKKMTGILKFFNPEFYEVYRKQLGEAMEWDKSKVSRDRGLIEPTDVGDGEKDK